MVDLENKIKTPRTGKNLTQLQIAERVGVTKSVISAYETSTRYPSYTILLKLAPIFGVTTDYLLGATKKSSLDTTGLSIENLKLVAALIDALKSKQSGE